MNWLNIIIGLFLLFTGRGLFWLFVACVGFASGYHYAQQILAIHSPLTVLIISWYEQKAVCVLLALLHLGIKGIRLGPSLPAFLTPNVLDTLVKNFDIKPIGTAGEDLRAILG